MFSPHTSGIFIAADLSLCPFSLFVWRTGFCLKNHRASLLCRGEIFCFPGWNHTSSVPREFVECGGRTFLVNLLASEMSLASLERSPNNNSEEPSTVDELQRAA